VCAKHPRQSAVIELKLTMINDTQTRNHLRGRVPFGRNDCGSESNNKVSKADLINAKPPAASLLASIVFHLL
jgi:hypothetical protein